MLQQEHSERYIPKRLELTQEHIEHIKDPIKKAIAEDYVRRGYWTVKQ